MSDLRIGLRTQFGFSDFRPGQAEAIGHLMADRHALVVMPTGAGKSLVYQFTSLYRKGIALVISPLISLMHDQVHALRHRGISSTCINSALSICEQERRLRKMVEGAFRLVYISPERLRNLAFRTAVAQVKVDLLVVDEAHCISEWGHDSGPTISA